MGQKINATGLRLKKKLNWNSVFQVHNKTSHWQIVSNIHKKNVVTNYLLNKLGFYSNNLITICTSKTLRISSKILAQNHLILTNASKRLQQQKPCLFNTNDGTILEVSKLYDKSPFLLISPKLITNHISKLLDMDSKLVLQQYPTIFSGSPTTNLNISIPTTLTRILKPFKHNILGIKIICSGKWKKTRSGRKQKICFKFGNIKKTTISSVILFDYLAKKTKHGVCGIKVWIAFKSYNKTQKAL